MSEFEKYLKEHKSQLDCNEANPEIWENIATAFIDKDKSTHYWLYAKSIAAMLVIGFLFNHFYLNSSSSSPSKVLANNNSQLESIISQKIITVSQAHIPITYKNDLQLLYEQVVYLDITHRDQLQYLKDYGYDVNISAEIDNYYKNKNRLLDKVILEIEKINNNELKYNTKSETATIFI